MTARTVTPAEFDAAEFALYEQLAKAEAERDRITARMHLMLGDSRRQGAWNLTDEAAEAYVSQLQASGDAYNAGTRMHPSELIAQLSTVRYQVTSFKSHIADMEAVYQADPWSRYFPCNNRDGHIHSSLRGCPTVDRGQYLTSMGWATTMSGLTADEAIHGRPGEFEGLGETLCSVCFPVAPAQWCRTRSEVTRAEREAARDAKNAERDAKLALKNLAEVFVTYDRDKVRTVAEAKRLVREAAETAVELEFAKSADGRARWNDSERHAQYVAHIEARLAGRQADAVKLNNILVEREIRLAGSGWTYAEHDRAVAGAVKRTRKARFS